MTDDTPPTEGQPEKKEEVKEEAKTKEPAYERVGEREIEELKKKSMETQAKEKRERELPLNFGFLKGMNKKRLAIVALVVAIFFLAYWIRVIPGRFNELPGLDEFYFYRLGGYALEHNLLLPEVDYLRFHPFGIQTYRNEFVMPVYLPLAMFLILKTLGIVGHWLTFVIIYPPIMGGLAAVAMFFLGREIYDWKAGAIAAFFLATEPAFITRTVAGVIEKEAAIAPFTVLTFYFFIRAFKRKSWLSGVLGGLSMAVIGMSSALAQYFYAILALFGLIVLLMNWKTENLVRSYLPVVLIGLFLPPLFVQHSTSIASFEGLPTIYFSVLVTGLIVIRLLVERFRLVKKPEQLKYVAPGIVMILVVGFFLSTLFIDSTASLLTGGIKLLTLKQESAIGFTVAENQPGSWGNIRESVEAHLSDNIFPQLSFASPYLTIWLFMHVGVLAILYMLWRKREFWLILILVWLLTGLYSVFYLIRLLFLFGPPAALVAGYGLGFLIDRALRLRESGKEKIRAVAKYTPFYILIFLGVLAAINIGSAYVYTANQGASICFADPKFLIDGTKCVDIVDGKEVLAKGQPWYDALTFMATQTPEDSNFISWWDFGYWYQTRGKRATPSDGGQGPRDETAHWYTSPVDTWNEQLPFLRDQYKVTHIIQDYTLPGKYGAITAIATKGKGTVGLQQFNRGEPFQQGNTTIQEFTAGEYAIWVPILPDGNLAGSPMLLVQKEGQYVQSGFINDVCTTQGLVHTGDQTPSVGGCVALSAFGVFYIPESAKNNIFVSLQFMDGRGLPVTKVFDNGFLKIYKINYPANATNSTAG